MQRFRPWSVQHSSVRLDVTCHALYPSRCGRLPRICNPVVFTCHPLESTMNSFTTLWESKYVLHIARAT
eukprot:3647974-Alexandrium_andersonii.AAC.1